MSDLKLLDYDVNAVYGKRKETLKQISDLFGGK